MNKHVRDVGIVLECGSKLNREDQFGKLITRFVPDETPTVSQLSDFVQASLLAGPVLKSCSLSAINLTVNRQSFDHRIHFARLDWLKRVANTSSRADALSTVSIVHLRDGNLFIRLRRMESSGYRMLPLFILRLLKFSKLLRGIKYKFTLLERIFFSFFDQFEFCMYLWSIIVW